MEEGLARVLDIVINGVAIALLIVFQVHIFYQIKIKLNLSTRFGFTVNTLALLIRFAIDVGSYLTQDYHLYPWKRWLEYIVQIVFFSFYVNNFSKVLLSWRL
jgi:hypothetical protein